MPNETERSPGRRSGTETDPDEPQSPDAQRGRNSSLPDEGEEEVE
jgi:hypothetical protein